MITNEEKTARRIFSKNLRKLMHSRATSRQQLADATDIPYTTLSDYIKGHTYPRAYSIQKLAAYFGVEPTALTDAKTSNTTQSVANPHLIAGKSPLFWQIVVEAGKIHDEKKLQLILNIINDINKQS